MRKRYTKYRGVWEFPAGWRRRRAQWRKKTARTPKFQTAAQRKEARKRDLKMGAIVMVATFVIGMAAVWIVPQLMPERVAVADTQQPYMAICGQGQRVSCVVDGDTIWLRGEKIRVADIDAPELFSPRCINEQVVAQQATYRLRDLLNAGPFTVEQWESRNVDDYGRSLRVLTRNGQSIGMRLVDEGLARRWRTIVSMREAGALNVGVPWC